MTKVLAGCRVIDHGNFITGPFATMMLADLGAEVIKVEQPGKGDPFRAASGGLYSSQFQANNRNKKSIVIDVKLEADRDLLREMIKSADVYVHNFRPGVVERWGLGATEMMALNERLVYCAISGFGHDGPYADRPVYDTVAQSMSGYLSLFVNPENPKVVGPAIADTITGLYAANGILGALYERQTTGKGRLVELSMIAAMTYFSIGQYQNYFQRGKVPNGEDRAKSSQSFALACSDGLLVALHLSSPTKFWEGLMAATELTPLLTDPRFLTYLDRVKNFDDLNAELRRVFATRPRAEWIARLEAQDVPHAPILKVDEVLADPQVQHLGLQVASTHPTEGVVRSIRRAVVYDRDVAGIETLAPPTLDEHGAQLRLQFGRP
jgi:crotonobetainyl-CoA:carnitine CoA-transferase CaiB-like acyl-CoA transferase